MERTVSDFLNVEYKDYSFYVLEQRAVASLVDGFKTTHRKIIYTADKHVRNSSNKVATLAGKVISDAYYHHGNVACEDAIVNLSQDFKNNVPLFDRIGQFGSLRSPKASASRYISVKLSYIFDKIYKDKELIEYKYEDNIKIEPYYYLPIIPIILVNGSLGIAIGYSTTILSRCPKIITKECISYLSGKQLKQLNPKINTFNGDFINDKENHKKWYIKGNLSIEKNCIVDITELPPSMTFSKIDDILEKLENNKKIISYDNLCTKNKVLFRVKFSKEEFRKHDKDTLMTLFKLTDNVTENYNVIDENGKLKIFETVNDMLKYFIDFRLTFYEKRKEYKINKTIYNINILTNKANFIKFIINKKLIIQNKKKDIIFKELEILNLDKIDDSYDYLLNMSIYSITKEKYDDILLKIKTEKENLKQIKLSIPKDDYINELKELYKIF